MCSPPGSVHAGNTDVLWPEPHIDTGHGHSKTALVLAILSGHEGRLSVMRLRARTGPCIGGGQMQLSMFALQAAPHCHPTSKQVGRYKPPTVSMSDQRRLGQGLQRSKTCR